MRKRKIKTWLITGVGVVFFAIILLVVFNTIAPKPPVNKVILARKSISSSRLYKAQNYIPLKYSGILKLYDSIMICWKIENQRFFLKRDFSRVESLADKIIILSDELKSESKDKIRNLETLLIDDIGRLDERTTRYDSVFKTVPLPENLIEKYTVGKLVFLECKLAFESKNYTLASGKLQSASDICNEVIDSMRLRLCKYFENHDQWVNLSNDAIKWSKRKKQSVLIIDKFAKACYLYTNGRLSDTFEIELGPNWIGSKRHRGDNATPEGKYMVSKKFTNRETKYYKALLLNYPNEEDQRRFNNEVNSGTLPKDSDIGGLIEIHGEGGKGFHWTNGCIALTNTNMDKVFKVSGIGTPVIVIGSLKNLSELYKLE